MTNLTYIYNGQIVLETGIIWDGAMVIADGIIQAVGTERELPCPAGATKIDAQGAYVGPGLVDIHVHAGNDLESFAHPKEVAEYFLDHGHTAFFPTPFYSQTLEEILDSIANVKAAMAQVPTIKGIYMEGPFTNPNYGANQDINPWRHEITAREYEAMVDMGGTDIKVWTVAPERTDLLPFMAYARKVNPDVVFALGHSEATPMQIRALGKYRPTLMTHIFDATGRQPVLIGTHTFLKDMGVEVPEGTRVHQALYAAIDGELAGVFAVNYNKNRASAMALSALCGYRSLTPVLTCSDFMLTESFLRSKFGINTRRVAFPAHDIRKELAAKKPAEDAKALALTTGEGILGMAFAVTGARTLRSASIFGVVLHMVAGILGLVIVALLATVGAEELLTAEEDLADTYFLRM